MWKRRDGGVRSFEQAGVARPRFFRRRDEETNVTYLEADLDGVARTLVASYRKSSAYNAELVAPAGSVVGDRGITPPGRRRGCRVPGVVRVGPGSRTSRTRKLGGGAARARHRGGDAARARGGGDEPRGTGARGRGRRAKPSSDVFRAKRCQQSSCIIITTPACIYRQRTNRRTAEDGRHSGSAGLTTKRRVSWFDTLRFAFLSLQTHLYISHRKKRQLITRTPAAFYGPTDR